MSSTESSSCDSLALESYAEEQQVLIAPIYRKVYVNKTNESPVTNSLLAPNRDKEKVGYESNEEVATRVKISSDLYPVGLLYDNKMGRCLVASRDIEPGEIVLKDWPLLESPNAEESRSTCLGCCVVKQESSLVPCYRCGWKVCNKECADVVQHADFECKVFSRENIQPNLPLPYSYIESAEYIKILRCLLLNDEDSPEKMCKWKQILSLEAHMEIRRHIPKVQLMSGLVKRFVLNLCKLTQYDAATIEFALGVVDVNAFRHSFTPAPLKSLCAETNPEQIRNATFLYPQASMAAHLCVRNTDWKTLAGGLLEMRAAHRILKGQVICHAYVDLMLGTPERRRLLHNLFYFECTCFRCADPTELGTYFSALKCTLCKTGYLLAENPLKHTSNWKCNNSECTSTQFYHYERDLVQHVLLEEERVLEENLKNNNLTSIKNLMTILKKHRDVTLHPNHYRILSIEYTLVKHLLAIKDPAKPIVLEMKRLVKKYMKISSVFHPASE